ncbi:peptidase YpeB-like protein [Luteimonas cucumeris]|uniref:Peptidase YpeB-like protein n=1 Tax=Luteimonas cucumeris TaxID=985012 RepID=A0A562L5X1_9GAMM|nr:PepSY domain-containing protein [Luteimonas cucumeris]TWI03060.1 peptidase YpeB-like protein [Luteimonas cucumeris]
MTRTRPYRLATVVLLLGTVSSMPLVPPARAGDDHDHVEARALLERGEILPLGRILPIAQKRVPGDVIEVELDHGKHGWEYEVKVLTATGRVREVKLNAATGTIRKVEDD